MTNRTETIGVVVSNIANYYFGEVIRGIEDVTYPRNYSLVVCNTEEILESENHYLDLLMRQRVDGIIAAATSQRWEALGTAESKKIPLVFLDRQFDGMTGPFVGSDNEGGAALGARHLIECGHRKIGILAGFPRLSSMRERLAGFRSVMAENNLTVPPEWVVESRLDETGGRTSALSILSRPDRPTALFINNNYLAVGALLALRELGLRCPRDVAMVVFDDHPWMAVSAPPLTVVRQQSRQQGQVAAQMVLALINGEPLAQTQVKLGCELVIRESSGVPLRG
jgi:LacI family transcriptional regulator